MLQKPGFEKGTLRTLEILEHQPTACPSMGRHPLVTSRRHFPLLADVSTGPWRPWSSWLPDAHASGVITSFSPWTGLGSV